MGEIVIPPMVVKDVLCSPVLMKELGRDADTVRKNLRMMVLGAAPFTHPKGNRRYKDFVMRILYGVLEEVDLIEAPGQCDCCSGTGTVEVSEECPRCNGAGCVYCAFDGTIPKLIQCPECCSPVQSSA